MQSARNAVFVNYAWWAPRRTAASRQHEQGEETYCLTLRPIFTFRNGATAAAHFARGARQRLARNVLTTLITSCSNHNPSGGHQRHRKRLDGQRASTNLCQTNKARAQLEIRTGPPAPVRARVVNRAAQLLSTFLSDQQSLGSPGPGNA